MKRTYRNAIDSDGLTAFTASHRETDLHVLAAGDHRKKAENLILTYRGHIESYIERRPEFLTALTPLDETGPAPPIVRKMLTAGQKAGTGPMAAVAGAVAEAVGIDLLKHSREVVVENGGDVFMKRNNVVTAAVFAGASPLSMKMGIKVDARKVPTAICTSSGTVGHSLSFGKSDAVVVLSLDTALADAVATAAANRVLSPDHIQEAVRFGLAIEGVLGVLVVMGDKLGAGGDIELARV